MPHALTVLCCTVLFVTASAVSATAALAAKPIRPNRVAAVPTVLRASAHLAARRAQARRVRARIRMQRLRALRLARQPKVFSPHFGKLPLRQVRWMAPQLATWYGPGFFGGRTACGSSLGRHTWGVAHRRLPCGTMVVVGFRGRRIAVPVIDRGPFSGATFDLSSRLAYAIGFTKVGAGVVKVGLMRKHRVPIARL